MDYRPVESVQADAPYEFEGRRNNRNAFEELTPEEQRILRECAREAIYQRAIPSGIAGGFGGFLAAKAGPLMHSKFGVKPAVVGFSILGYFIGRFSYSNICFERVMQVPGGKLQKMFADAKTMKEQNRGLNREDFYAKVEPPKSEDTRWTPQSGSTDIDVAAISNFDTTPSDYYKEDSRSLNEQAEVKPPTNSTSYDELRNQNRQEYKSRLYPATDRNNPQHRQPEVTDDDTVRRRRFVQRQDDQPSTTGVRRNKYGDVME